MLHSHQGLRVSVNLAYVLNKRKANVEDDPIPNSYP